MMPLFIKTFNVVSLSVYHFTSVSIAILSNETCMTLLWLLQPILVYLCPAIVLNPMHVGLGLQVLPLVNPSDKAPHHRATTTAVVCHGKNHRLECNQNQFMHAYTNSFV